MDVLVFAFFFVEFSEFFSFGAGCAVARLQEKKTRKPLTDFFPEKERKPKKHRCSFRLCVVVESQKKIFFLLLSSVKKKGKFFVCFFLVFVERRKDFFKNHRAQKSADGGFL